MTRILALFITVMMLISLVSCGDINSSENKNSNEEQNSSDVNLTEQSSSSTEVKQSSDKYTWYIKNYVGRNCATIGYTSIGGDRLDKYGKALLEILFVTQDGTYVDISSDDELKGWMVFGQNLAPNTELKLVFEKDSEGYEYDNLIEHQSFKEIVLSVKKVGDTSDVSMDLTTINPSPDKYTYYIYEYIGRNLMSCGYTSIGGDRLDTYGKAHLKLIFVTQDGTYIDIFSDDALKDWVVVGQNMRPNTEIDIVYAKDSEGYEYNNLIEYQSIDEIELYVKRISS